LVYSAGMISIRVTSLNILFRDSARLTGESYEEQINVYHNDVLETTANQQYTINIHISGVRAAMYVFSADGTQYSYPLGCRDPCEPKELSVAFFGEIDRIVVSVLKDVSIRYTISIGIEHYEPGLLYGLVTASFVIAIGVLVVIEIFKHGKIKKTLDNT